MIHLAWLQRHDLQIAPLKPVAMWISLAAVGVLMAANLSTQRQQQLRCLVTSTGWLLLSASDGSDLPWLEGATWLGRDVAYPQILMPTLLLPSLPPAWLSPAVQRLQPGVHETVLLPAAAVQTREQLEAQASVQSIIVPIISTVSLAQALRWQRHETQQRTASKS
jgi:hypothetical protein